MNPIHDQFVAEARELVLQTNDDLIELERHGFDSGCVDRIMRSFHTLKGSAGVVQLPAMTMMLHAAEDLMVAIQEAKLFPSKDVITEALNCVDLVSRWIDAFEATGALPADAGEDGRAVAERLRNLTSGKVSEETVSGSVSDLPAWAVNLQQQNRASSEAANHPLFAIRYQPHVGCFYDGDDPLKLLRKMSNVLALNIGMASEPGSLSELDPYACHLIIEALVAESQETLAEVFKNVPDQVRIIALPPSQTLDEQPGSNALGIVPAVLEEQQEILRVTTGNEGLAGRIGAVARVAANALRHAGRGELADRVGQGGATAVASHDVAPLLRAIDEAVKQLKVVATPPATAQSQAGRVSDSEGVAGRTLRVDEARIENLVNLAGELIVLKNSFSHLAKRMELEKSSSADLLHSVRREYDRIERLAEEMQGAILQLRMVPVAQVLRAFSRLVRDLSQQLGKNVRLVTQGETTEGDKTVIDRLFEPLLHLVRNALDHGIEPPEERLAAGKDAAATLTIRTSRSGDRLVIEVIDDGRGIDPGIIRRRAIEKGLLTKAQSTETSDENVIELVFAAGFSTAEQTSDISGRGVGMDVVRTIVDQIGGRVSIESRVGQGTAVKLDVPTNIATSQIMVVECAGQAFGVPMEHVVETVRLTPDRISEVKNNEGFVLRDRVVPICSLAELLNLPKSSGPKTGARLVMVTETGGKVAAVEIEAIRDRMEVVMKPMQGLLSKTGGYAGTTLLGDGAVLLVVDLKELLP